MKNMKNLLTVVVVLFAFGCSAMPNYSFPIHVPSGLRYDAVAQATAEKYGDKIGKRIPPNVFARVEIRYVYGVVGMFYDTDMTLEKGEVLIWLDPTLSDKKRVAWLDYMLGQVILAKVLNMVDDLDRLYWIREHDLCPEMICTGG